jgi:ATP-dependent DNA helicase PIF1
MEDEAYNKEQIRAIDLARDGHNLHLYGNPGTGKTHTTRKIIDEVNKKYPSPGQVCVMAPTGSAAVYIGGTTINSWAGLGLMKEDHNKLLQLANQKPTNWLNAKVIVLDEVSMVHCTLLETMDFIARKLRKCDAPFGGIQVVLIGDFFQLAPVPREKREPRTFAFEAHCFEKCIDYHVELLRVYRQSDPTFIKLLKEARIGQLSEESCQTLRQRILPPDVALPERNGVLPTNLYCRNSDKEGENSSRLKELRGKERVYIATSWFNRSAENGKPRLEFMQKNLATPERLLLRIGAQVMITANTYAPLVDDDDGDEERVKVKVVNGQRAVVVDLDQEYVDVRLVDGGTVRLEPFEWCEEKIVIRALEGKKDIVIKERIASIKQIPLLLAWAVTIHKAQGQTLDYMTANISGAFACGQAYVAISRAVSLDGLYLGEFDKTDFKAHPKVIDFYKSIRPPELRLDDTPKTKKRKNDFPTPASKRFNLEYK